MVLDEEKRTGTLLIAVDTSCEMTGGDIDSAALEKFTGSMGTVVAPVSDFNHLYWLVYGMSTQAARRLAYGDIRGEGTHI